MDGVSTETLAFLIDIQEHGASQLRALSADFGVLGASADRISKQLATMQGELDKAGASSVAAGQKVATGAKAATDATSAQAKATDDLIVSQKSQAGQSDAVTAASDRLTAAQKAQTDTTVKATTALGEQATTATRAAGATDATAGVTRKHTSSLTDHKSGLEKSTAALKGFGTAMLPVSVGIAAIGGYAIKMGVDFESAMERLHTQAGYAQKDIAGLESQVIKAAPALRRTPTELAEGLYHVASVGIPAADAMKVMTAASIGANIGASNLEDTANALVIALKNMHQPASMASQDMGLLNEIVGAGNMHMEELVGVLGKVLPQATNVGLNLRDVGAALDVMTGRGLPAARAATILGTTFSKLEAPTEAAKKSFAEIGLSGSSLAEEMRKPNGLIGAMEMLKDHLDKTFPPGRKLTLEQERQALLTYKKGLEEAGVGGTTLTKDLEAYSSKLVQTGTAATAQSQVLINAFGGSRMSAGVLTLIQNMGELHKTYDRLPTGAAALKNLTGAQAEWEKTTGAQLDAVKASFDTSMTSIGKSIGPVLVPVLKEATDDVQKLVEGFESLSPSVQHDIEKILGLIAVLGPAAILTAKVLNAGKAIGGAVGGAGRMLSGSSSAAGAGNEAAAMEQTAAGGIFGMRGDSVAAGSIMNPIAVQVVNSMGGGGGGAARSAEGDAESDAARVGGQSEGGVLLPAGVDATEAVEGAGAIGLGSRVAGIGKSLAGGALKGGAIALGGYAVSNIAGSLVGGKTGSAISQVGGDASIGAGVGSLAGPEGTVAGAVIGALVGGLKVALDKPTFGQELAKTMGAGLTSAQRAGFKESGDEKATASALDAEHKYQQELAYYKQQGGSNSELPAPRVSISNAEAYKGGTGAAKAIEAAAGNTKFPDIESTIKKVEGMFEQMPARSRDAGVQSIIQWTAGMQAEGRLPEGSTEKLISSIERKWPELTSYLHNIGMSSIRELAKSLEGKEAIEAARNQIAEVSKTFGGLAPLLAKDGGNVEEEWHTTLDYLVGETHSKMPQVREAAEAELAKLKPGTAKLMAGWETQLVQNFNQAGIKGASAFQGGMDTLVGNIRAAMAHGLVSVQQGNAMIQKALGTEERALGVSPAEQKKGEAFTGGSSGSLSSLTGSSGPLGATGMRVPGSGLEDTVPILSPQGGVRGIVAPGELLIANRHTERAASLATQMVYGRSLADMVLNENRPHSAPMLAKGGFIADPGTIQNVGELPQITGDLRRMGEAMGWEVYGISGYRSPQHSMEVGGFANDPHTRGEAEDVGINSQSLSSAAALTAAILARFGLERPFYPASAHEINHVQLLGSINNPSASGAKGQVPQAVAAAAKAIKKLKDPKWTGPGGSVGRMGEAVLKKATHDANRKLEMIANQSPGGGANLSQFNGGGGSPSANEILGKKMMEADGHPASEWPYLQKLWTEESGWSDTVMNNPAGQWLAAGNASGIPQADGQGDVYPRGQAAPQIAWGLHYIDSKYKTPQAAYAFENSHTPHWYSQGGLMPQFAGAFAHGGSATANRPTMAMFGENGPETAIFVPHATTGTQLLESIGVTPPPAKGSKEVEGLNPDNNQIEYHTAAEWTSIRLHHSQATKAKGKKAATPEVEDAVQLEGMQVGTILSKAPGTINVPGDVGKLSAETWKKVVAAIEHTLSNTATPAGFDVQATEKIVKDAHKNPKLKELAGKALTDTTTAVMRTASSATASESPHANATAINQLQVLISQARANGSTTLISGLRKDVQTTATNWQKAIATALSKSEAGTTAKETLKIARSNLHTVKTKGPTATLATAGADPSFLHAEEQDQQAAIAQMKSERAQLAKLVKQLDTQMKKALQKHHKAQAKAIEAEIHEIDSQIGEVTTSIGESTANIAQLQIEFAQKVYEEVKNQIDEADATFESRGSILSSIGQQEQQERKNRGEAPNFSEIIQNATEQRSNLEGEQGYDQSILGSLSGSDKTQMEQKIAELSLNISQLTGTVQEQIKLQIAEIQAQYSGENTHASLEAQIEQQELHNKGLDLSGLQEDASKQNGLLTPAQVKQAEQDLVTFIAGVKAQAAPLEGERGYDESILPTLQGPERQEMENTILGLTLQIEQLNGSIVDQKHATEALTESTKTNSNTMAQFTGSVSFSYNSQQYVSGQTSDLVSTPSVGM
jgi:Phage-related minor tail protein